MAWGEVSHSHMVSPPGGQTRANRWSSDHAISSAHPQNTSPARKQFGCWHTCVAHVIQAGMRSTHSPYAVSNLVLILLLHPISSCQGLTLPCPAMSCSRCNMMCYAMPRYATDGRHAMLCNAVTCYVLIKGKCCR